MKKFFKRLGWIVLIALIVLIIGAFASAAIFEKQIGNRIVSELNKQLTSELTVGSLDMSVLSTFPNIAANLRDIRLKDSRGANLLEADKLSFRFGLFSFLTSKYQIRSVKLSDGALFVYVDAEGNPNYEVVRTGNEASGGEGNDRTAVSLDLAMLSNMEMIYVNEQTRQYINLLLESAAFSGQFSSAQFDLNSDARIQSRFVEVEGLRYLVGRPLTYDAQVRVDLQEGIYQLQQVTAGVSDNSFKVDGVIEDREKGTYFDLFINNENGNLEGVMQLLPEEYARQLGDFSSTGNFDFTATIQGEYNPNLNPEVRAQLGLNNGRIQSPRLANDLKEVAFVASYSNGKYRDRSSSILEISNLQGYFNRELTELKLRVDNFEDPVIDFQFDGIVPLNAVYGLFNSPSITGGSGEIEVQNLRLKGNYEDMIRVSRADRIESSGVLEFDDAALAINGEKLILDRGTLTLDKNRMDIASLKLEGAGSDIEFEGTAFNVIPVLFADSLNSRQAELEFEAELTSGKLDIDRLLTLTRLKLSEKDTTGLSRESVDSLQTATLIKRERLTRLLNGTFKTQVKEFNYEKIEGADFTGLVEFSDSRMTIRGGTNAMGGVMDVDGELYFDRQQSRLEARVTTEAIDLNTFFVQTDNFGQEVLTSRNISGKLDAQILIQAYWDEKGAFDADRMQVVAGVAIKDGILEKFEMLEAFSSFVKVEDLRNIRFVDLRNVLEIRRQRLYIPKMFVQSNAMNLTISGEHGFDNEFEYNLKVNAGQVLANKFKKHDPSLQPLKARKNGFFNLYYQIFGALDDYQFKTARRNVREDFERSEYRMREALQALQAAFGEVRFLEEPEEWQDSEAAGADPTEYLDFEVEGGGKEKKTGGNGN